MKFIPLLLLLLIVPCKHKAANPNPDSLKRELESAKGSQQLVILEQLSAYYSRLRQTDTAMKYDSLALEISQKTGDDLARSNILNNLGIGFYAKGDYANSILLFRESMVLKEKIGDTIAIVKALNNLGVLYQLTADYEQAISMLMQSLEIRKRQGDTIGIARTYNNISVIYKNINQTEQSLQMLNEAYEIYLALDDTEGLASVYNNYGTVYQLLSENELAKYYYLKSLEKKEGSADRRSLANTLNNLGMVYQALDNLEEAHLYYLKALEIRTAIKDRFGLASVYFNLGNLFMRKNEMGKAQENFAEAISFAEEGNFRSLLQRIYNDKALLLAKENQFELAYQFAMRSSALKDSIYTEQLNTSIAELEARQRTDRMHRENELLRIDNELKALTIKRNRTGIFMGLVLFLFAVTLVFAIWKRLHEKRRLTASLEQSLKLLAESEDKYRTVVEQSHEAIFIHWGNRLLFANKYLLKISGLSEMEIYQRQPELLITIADRPAFSLFLSKEGKDPSLAPKNEFRLETKTGELRWLEMSQVKISLHGEEAFLVIARDITDRKQTSELIRKLEQAVRQSPVSTLITDAKGNIEYVNQKFCEMSGYTAGELQGKNPRVLKSEKMDQAIYTQIWKTITAGEVWKGELLNKNKEGKLFWEAVTISPIFDENQIITHYLGVKEDITQRKANDERLRKSEERLREANAAKDKFFSIIAHDLKNPFNAILGFSNLLLTEYDEFNEGEKKEFIANIHEASASSFRLLQNLLDWSRTQTGAIQFNPEKFDLKLVLDEIITLNNSSLISKEIALATNLCDGCYVMADQNMVLTVMRNLVSNAIKFTPKGGKVNISCLREKGFYRISVSDTGIGIPEDQLGIMFQVDKQPQRPGTDNEKGTGLGLLLCAEFVQMNGGEIWVESRENEGSSFHFTIKAADLPSSGKPL